MNRHQDGAQEVDDSIYEYESERRVPQINAGEGVPVEEEVQDIADFITAEEQRQEWLQIVSHTHTQFMKQTYPLLKLVVRQFHFEVYFMIIANIKVQIILPIFLICQFGPINFSGKHVISAPFSAILQKLNIKGTIPMVPFKPPPILSLFLALFLLLPAVLSAQTFKEYPLADDYFEKIYLVNHNSQQYYLTISCREQNMLSISITPNKEFIQSPSFNIYGSLPVRPKMGRGSYTFLQECHSFVKVNSSKFLQVKRSQEGETIFSIEDLSVLPTHTQFTVHDRSVKWGFGERFQKRFHVTDGTWTIWNRDKPWKIDEGKPGVSEQTYGHHPLYLARERESKYFHLAYFKNTNGLMVQSTSQSNQLKYHSIGGPIHFLIILGKEDPEHLLQKYHQFIGRGHIPPFWSFGYHQCRWGYRSLNDIKQMVKKYNQHDIPLDTFWSDLEYMNSKMIFTVNEGTHPSRDINALMKNENLHFVPLLDVGVAIHDGEAVNRGKELNVFLRDYRNEKDYYTGQVWPGVVHFVDYLHPNATLFWKEQLDRLRKSINFSGIWLDMNEPSNFRGGQPVEESFRIQHQENLNMMTISSELHHYNELNPSSIIKHKEVHAYFGHLSAVATYEHLKQHGRPFIITRSTSVGSGHFIGHWTGDNVATWDFLRLSISGNFLFQIFGIQMVGADICGFYQDTTEELCARWHQLGAFYPFARNHNHDQGRSQQPYAFGPKLLDTSRESLKTRYALLKQLYTIYLSKKGRGSYYRPIIFEFFNDEKAYEEEMVETQVLIGKFLMTTPIVYPGHDQRDVYFPGSGQSWCQFMIDIKSGKVRPDKIANFDGNTKQVILNPLPSAPPTFLRAGYLLLTNEPVNRSNKLANQFHIFAVLKEDKATGSILGIQDYNDEPSIQKCINEGCLYELSIKKIGEQTFSISWKYQGNKDIMRMVKFKSILIVSGAKKWASETTVVINNAQGSTTVQVQTIW